MDPTNQTVAQQQLNQVGLVLSSCDAIIAQTNKLVSIVTEDPSSEIQAPRSSPSASASSASSSSSETPASPKSSHSPSSPPYNPNDPEAMIVVVAEATSILIKAVRDWAPLSSSDVMVDYLLSCSRHLRRSALEFVKATRSSLVNRLDFLTVQAQNLKSSLLLDYVTVSRLVTDMMNIYIYIDSPQGVLPSASAEDQDLLPFLLPCAGDIEVVIHSTNFVRSVMEEAQTLAARARNLIDTVALSNDVATLLETSRSFQLTVDRFTTHFDSSLHSDSQGICEKLLRTTRQLIQMAAEIFHDGSNVADQAVELLQEQIAEEIFTLLFHLLLSLRRNDSPFLQKHFPSLANSSLSVVSLASSASETLSLKILEVQHKNSSVGRIKALWEKRTTKDNVSPGSSPTPVLRTSSPRQPQRPRSLKARQLSAVGAESVYTELMSAKLQAKSLGDRRSAPSRKPSATRFQNPSNNDVLQLQELLGVAENSPTRSPSPDSPGTPEVPSSPETSPSPPDATTKPEEDVAETTEAEVPCLEIDSGTDSDSSYVSDTASDVSRDVSPMKNADGFETSSASVINRSEKVSRSSVTSPPRRKASKSAPTPVPTALASSLSAAASTSPSTSPTASPRARAESAESLKISSPVGSPPSPRSRPNNAPTSSSSSSSSSQGNVTVVIQTHASLSEVGAQLAAENGTSGPSSIASLSAIQKDSVTKRNTSSSNLPSVITPMYTASPAKRPSSIAPGSTTPIKQVAESAEKPTSFSLSSSKTIPAGSKAQKTLKKEREKEKDKDKKRRISFVGTLPFHKKSTESIMLNPSVGLERSNSVQFVPNLMSDLAVAASMQAAVPIVVSTFSSQFSWFNKYWQRETLANKQRFINILKQDLASISFKPDPQQVTELNEAERSQKVDFAAPHTSLSSLGVNKKTLKEDAKEEEALQQLAKSEYVKEWKHVSKSYSQVLSPDAVKKLPSMAKRLNSVMHDFVKFVTSGIAPDQVESKRSDLSQVALHVGPVFQVLFHVVQLSTGTTDNEIVSKLATPTLTSLQAISSAGTSDAALISLAEESRSQIEVLMILYNLRTNTYDKLTNLEALLLQTVFIIKSVDVQNSKLSHANTLQLIASVSSIITTVKAILNQISTFDYIRTQISTKSFNTEADKIKQTERDDNIWTEYESYTDRMDRVTLNQLVWNITKPKDLVSAEAQRAFNLTYRTFASPAKLFSKLVERFNVPDDLEEFKEQKQVVQQRVSEVLMEWISVQYFDLDKKTKLRLMDFINEGLHAQGFGEIANQLIAIIDKKETEQQQMFINTVSFKQLDFSSIQEYMNVADMFMAMDAKTIAEQLTYHDFSIFKRIRVHELIGQAWNKGKLKYSASNVLDHITRLNHVSYWVPSLILWSEKVKQRANVMWKFICIGEELHKLHNYNTMMGILAGLNMSCITRLHFTKSFLSDAQISKLEDLANLMSPRLSFKNFRDSITAAGLPAIPYLGVYLTDLTFVDEGNPSDIDSMLNFSKRIMVANILQEVTKYQASDFAIQPQDPLFTFLKEFPSLDSDGLYSLSLTREPRGANILDIV